MNTRKVCYNNLSRKWFTCNCRSDCYRL